MLLRDKLFVRVLQLLLAHSRFQSYSFITDSAIFICRSASAEKNPLLRAERAVTQFDMHSNYNAGRISQFELRCDKESKR